MRKDLQKPPVTENQIRQGLQRVLHCSRNQYALTYARTALELNMKGYKLGVQVLYVLSNLSGWSGDEARNIKAMFKRFYKEVATREQI